MTWQVLLVTVNLFLTHFLWCILRRCEAKRPSNDHPTTIGDDPFLVHPPYQHSTFHHVFGHVDQEIFQNLTFQEFCWCLLSMLIFVFHFVQPKCREKLGEILGSRPFCKTNRDVGISSCHAKCRPWRESMMLPYNASAYLCIYVLYGVFPQLVNPFTTRPLFSLG